MPPKTLIDPSKIDPNRVVHDIESIRRSNPQRFEMEQLSWICHLDVPAGEIVGVLDIAQEPFWARGHVPGRPIMPGVLMLESAAQLCSFFVRRIYDEREYGGRFFGFGGIDDVKYRWVVFPGQRLVVQGKRIEVRPRRAVFDTQGYVDDKLVFEARITGMWV